MLSVAEVEDLMEKLTKELSQENLLKLRLVNKAINNALEANPTLELIVHSADKKFLKTEFLQRWQGPVSLHCVIPWTPTNEWFKEFSDELELGRWRAPRTLCLSVDGGNLRALIRETLRGIKAMVPTKRLDISYHGRGSCSELLAAIRLAQLSDLRNHPHPQFMPHTT